MSHLRLSALRIALAAAALSLIAGVLPGSISIPIGAGSAHADEEPPPPPPLPDDETYVPDDQAPPGDAATGAGEPPPGGDLVPMRPGEAVVTRFSHWFDQPDAEGQPVPVIDINGISASIIDIRRPGQPPAGQHWVDDPQRLFVTAGEVGQVFGVALADRPGETEPDIFLSATAAFGLHLTGKAPGNTEWMGGMWGPDAGPGSIYVISPDTGYLAEKFTDVTLDGRPNSGAALGNIAHDRWHRRLFVSDMETGMIHSLDDKTGRDMGRFDHGTAGRASFLDAWTGQRTSLPPVSFDPSTSAQVGTCAGDFATTPECWNIADFRRRVWGLNVRQDASGEVRLFYSVWGSDAFGNPEWADAGDDRRNSVWSVAITQDGLFDESSVRREFFMAPYWPVKAAMGDKAGNSNPVSDISFAQCGPQDVMLVSERGGMRNLGLGNTEPFTTPYESRVLRYERGQDGIWRPKGRYDVGFHDRSIRDGEPVEFSSASGGAAFGYGFGDASANMSAPSQSVWMTGDGLCSADGPCTNLATGEHSDVIEVHGLQGTPADAFVPLGPSQSTAALDNSYMIDTDVGLNARAPSAAEFSRNDATKIGDVAIFELCASAPPLTEIDVPEEELLPPEEPPGDWPVHTLNMSHNKWASNSHRVDRSWHYREGSWHDVDRSWHWRNQSYHSRNESWHWRGGSYHSKARSWHLRGRSLHDRNYSWHSRDRSWHLRSRSYHNKARSWDGNHHRDRSYHVKSRTWGNGHVKSKSYHVKDRSWTGNHDRSRSYHVKDRSWTGNHVKGRSYHQKARSWDGNNPNHVKGRSYHNKGKTWGDNNRPDHVKGRSYHNKGKTWGDDNRPDHVKGRSYHNKGKTWGDDGRPDHVKGRSTHNKGKTWGDDNRPDHVKGRSTHNKGKTWGDDGRPQHSKQKSDADKRPQHSKRKSDADRQPQHSKRKSDADKQPQHGKKKSDADRQPQHSKRKSDADRQPQHSKRKSDADRQPQHSKRKSDADKQPQHSKRKSDADKQPQHGKKKSAAAQQGDVPVKKKRVHNPQTSEMVVVR